MNMDVSTLVKCCSWRAWVLCKGMQACVACRIQKDQNAFDMQQTCNLE